MWTILAEKPLLLAIMIGIVAGGLLYTWLQTGNRRLAIAGILAACCVPATFLIAEQIETDREKILAIIDATIEAVEENDHQAAVAAIADPATRAQALAELPRYEFSNVSVRNIQINMVEGSYPPEATADCDASGRVSMTRGSIKNMHFARRVILTFRQEPDGSWVVADYTHRPLAGGPDGFTPQQTVR